MPSQDLTVMLLETKAYWKCKVWAREAFPLSFTFNDRPMYTWRTVAESFDLNEKVGFRYNRAFNVNILLLVRTTLIKQCFGKLQKSVVVFFVCFLFFVFIFKREKFHFLEEPYLNRHVQSTFWKTFTNYILCTTHFRKKKREPTHFIFPM